MTARSALRVGQAAAGFARLPPVGATVTLVAVGLAAGEHPGDLPRAAAVTVAAVFFHIGVYVGNDVMDVEIDRTDPRRAHLPLPTGSVPMPWAVVTVVVSLLMGAIVLGSATSDATVLGYYALATAGLLGYDVFGKRSRVPPVLDIVQGAGWSCLVLVAVASAGDVTAAGGWLACSAGLYVALVNGVVASLRDLPNDHRHGARTTAVLFMAARGAMADRLPATYRAYALVLHVLMAVTCVLGVAAVVGGTAARSEAVLAITLAGELLCLLLLIVGLHRYDGATGGWRIGFLYIVLALWCLCTPVLARFGALAFGGVSIVLLAPWLGSRVVRSLFQSPDRDRVRGRA